MIIFDFDMTLVDTAPAQSLRAARRWTMVMSQMSKLLVYDGIGELLNALDRQGRQIGIVTKSPDMVPKAFIKAHKWPIHIVIGYHQVRNHKPNPEGLILAMRRAGAKPNETIHVGDKPEDTEACRAVNILSVGAAWGTEDRAALEASKPDYIFDTVSDLGAFLLC